MHSIGAQISSIYPVRKDERIFQNGCGLFTDLGFSDLTAGKTERRQHLSHVSAAAIPPHKKTMVFWQPGRITHWCELVGDGDMLEGVCFSPAAACPVPCVLPKV